jgi:hypothetical protein
VWSLHMRRRVSRCVLFSSCNKSMLVPTWRRIEEIWAVIVVAGQRAVTSLAASTAGHRHNSPTYGRQQLDPFTSEFAVQLCIYMVTQILPARAEIHLLDSRC